MAETGWLNKYPDLYYLFSLEIICSPGQVCRLRGILPKGTSQNIYVCKSSWMYFSAEAI